MTHTDAHDPSGVTPTDFYAKQCLVNDILVVLDVQLSASLQFTAFNNVIWSVLNFDLPRITHYCKLILFGF